MPEPPFSIRFLDGYHSDEARRERHARRLASDKRALIIDSAPPS